MARVTIVSHPGTCRAIMLASKRVAMIYLLARCLSIDGLDSPGDCDVDGLFRAASVHGSPSSMLDSAARVRQVLSTSVCPS
jgi:hypothetical protein